MASPVSQNTPSSLFVNYVLTSLQADAMKQVVRSYTFPRNIILGIVPPAIQQNRQQQLLAARKAAEAGQQTKIQLDAFAQYSSLSLRQRLAAIGPSFGPLMAAATTLKGNIESLINDYLIENFGAAISNISPASEWSWLFEKDASGTNLLFFPNGGNTFSLPGNPFMYLTPSTPPANVPPATWFGVTITVDTNGNGTPSFSTGGSIASGAISGGTAWTGADPL